MKNKVTIINTSIMLMSYFLTPAKITLAGDYYTTQQTPKSNINNIKELNNSSTEYCCSYIYKILKKIDYDPNSCAKQTKSDIKKQVDSLIENERYADALQIAKKNKVHIKSNRETVDLQLALREALILNKLGYTDKAYALYKQLTLLFPEIPELWNNLAVICTENGLNDDAIYYINMSVKCCPKYKIAEDNKNIINKLRDPNNDFSN